MAKQKFYAVKNGRTTGVLKSWDDCLKSIEGFSGAVYKSFSSFDEATAFLNDVSLSDLYKKDAADNNMVIAYVDGSYSDTLKKYSFGCVLILPDGTIVEEKDADDQAEAVGSRNVAGELKGAMFSVNFALKNGYNKIIIKHDYEGISKWFIGAWKANSYCATEYVKYMSKVKGKIAISFEKVDAHTGNKFNDRADALAKEALGIL